MSTPPHNAHIQFDCVCVAGHCSLLNVCFNQTVCKHCAVSKLYQSVNQSIMQLVMHHMSV